MIEMKKVSYEAYIKLPRGNERGIAMVEMSKGTIKDLEELETLYNDVNDYFSCHTNYAGWKKDVYPIRSTAEDGIREDSLFVARMDSKIVGTLILRHQPEPAYRLVDWNIELEDEDVLVIYTLAVHPAYFRKNVGKDMIDFVLDYAKKGKIKAARLDVYEKNNPAINLYESCGFQFIDSVDLGYREYGLDWFNLYQYIL